MILKIENNNDSRTVISVKFESKLDEISHGNFNGREKFITIDKGLTHEWTIHYEDDSMYTFSLGRTTTIYGKEVGNLIKLCKTLLNKCYIDVEDSGKDTRILVVNMFETTDSKEDRYVSIENGDGTLFNCNQGDIMEGGLFEDFHPMNIMKKEGYTFKRVTKDYNHNLRADYVSYLFKLSNEYVDYLRSEEKGFIRINTKGEIIC